MKHETIKPSQRKRYEFIEFQLMWEGTIGRKLLKDKFEISLQQATLDLTSYLDLEPKNMTYDPRQRTYVAQSNFRPAFVEGEATEYLQHLEMLHHGYRAADEIWPASVPEFDAVRMSSRKTDPVILKTVLRAIRNRHCVEVMYVSLSSESESPRFLYPQAIASDGHRWHMRAFDSDKERHSDFVLSRIEKVTIKESDVKEIPEDDEWSTIVYLRLRPDPNLAERQRERLEVEYDMNDGELLLQVRQAMLFYYLRFYGFNPLEVDGGMIRNKSSFSLNIVNLEEIERCLKRRN
ncbi:WYL domain-containing protein [Loktanella sp. M215]|uniref:WYL domain-containing protein n=1 Tax=Loktanella sp. M215 TaxID=2675431 RepID=UPI001F1E7940|nr:WYL domain-containing protein [Loktanella sp. M215]